MGRTAQRVRALLAGIAETWIAPGRAVRRLAATNPGEEKLLAWLMIASLVSFLVRSPQTLQSGLESDTLAGLFGAQIVASMLFGPLAFYALAALSHLAMRVSGGTGSGRNARLALFWSAFALQPLVIAVAILGWLLPGLHGVLLLALGLFFLSIWLRALLAVERGKAVNLS
ncbi:MAG: YIP1 family protein [Rhodobacteraceae bacterium]|nr:YIP1 family protein [Paracoccaceae bacterium]